MCLVPLLLLSYHRSSPAWVTNRFEAWIELSRGYGDQPRHIFQAKRYSWLPHVSRSSGQCLAPPRTVNAQSGGGVSRCLLPLRHDAAISGVRCCLDARVVFAWEPSLPDSYEHFHNSEFCPHLIFDDGDPVADTVKLASSGTACHKIFKINNRCANFCSKSPASAHCSERRLPTVVCCWRNLSTSVSFDMTLQRASSNVRTSAECAMIRTGLRSLIFLWIHRNECR